MAGKRRIIAYLATSADGFIARPDGAVDWLERKQPKGGYGMGAFYRSIDTILWGRKTYEMVLRFQQEGKMATPFDPGKKHYLFTRTLTQKAAAAGVELVREPIPAFAARLRAARGKNIWMMGGAGIMASFLDAGEIDEFDLHVIPTLIGEGIPLLAPRHRTVPLKLLACKKFPDGVVQLHYAVRRR